ncbi:MAG: hypothetical protein Q9217_002612, partial [Psora testacea]
CGVHFIGEDAIKPCASYYLTDSGQRNKRYCPDRNFTSLKRDTGQHPPDQPCSGSAPSRRKPPPVVTNSMYARPGDLFDDTIRRRVSEVVGKSAMGKEIASATEILKTQNQGANGAGREFYRRAESVAESKNGKNKHNSGKG